MPLKNEHVNNEHVNKAMALMSVKIAKKKCSMSLDSVFWISGFSNARPESLDDILSFSWKGVLWQYSPHSVIAVYD